MRFANNFDRVQEFINYVLVLRDFFVSWQKILAQGFSSAQELLLFLDLPPALGNECAEQVFKTRVPRSFALRMKPKDPRDPLLLQVLALQEENIFTPEFTQDPLEEKKKAFVPGLLHKYHGRVLLTLAGACAINCRYCFRRHFPYAENNPGKAGWSEALAYIQQDPSIQEVILSGGDPLLLKDEPLFAFIKKLEVIPHVTTLRFHTRIPIVLPERITNGFLTQLQEIALKVVFVLHSNHPQEINQAVIDACTALRTKALLLNQSVLLKHINNSAQTLAELSKALFKCHTLPYYLHTLDKVMGTAHFDIPLAEALTIYKQLQTLLPGYLVPKLAREEPGKQNKTLLIGA